MVSAPCDLCLKRRPPGHSEGSSIGFSSGCNSLERTPDQQGLHHVPSASIPDGDLKSMVLMAVDFLQSVKFKVTLFHFFDFLTGWIFSSFHPSYHYHRRFLKMSTGSGLFGLKIPAGQIVPLDIFSDVRITNIAFGETITGKGRSVVKVHRARFADLLDEMSDDDEDDEDDDEEEDEDEDEDEEDDETAVEKASSLVNGIKKAVAAKVNGKDAEEEGSDSEQGVYDEDEDSDSDVEGEMIEDEFVICSLYPEKTEQAIIDLEFSVEEEIAFSVTGENDVELIGYYIQSDPYDDDPDSDELYSDEDEYDSDELAMYDEEDSDEEMEDDQPRIKEILERAAAKAGSEASKSKKRAKGEDSDEEVEATKDSIEHLSKNQRKKLNKKMRTEVAEEKTEEVKEKKEKPKEAVKEKKVEGTKKSEAPKKDAEKASGKTKTASGLLIEDKQVGKGPQAKAGNRIGMRYVGRLQSGKQFDANTKGKPFSFKLGKGEVIAGWDEGVKGMQVGGTRRLTIPPQLAYGKQGAPPDIPPNSTLIFDVKLVEIK
jgi:FK506-binding nuclear protein